MRIVSFAAFFLLFFLADATVSLANPQKAPTPRESGASRASAIRCDAWSRRGDPLDAAASEPPFHKPYTLAWDDLALASLGAD